MYYECYKHWYIVSLYCIYIYIHIIFLIAMFCMIITRFNILYLIHVYMYACSGRTRSISLYATFDDQRGNSFVAGFWIWVSLKWEANISGKKTHQLKSFRVTWSYHGKPMGKAIQKMILGTQTTRNRWRFTQPNKPCVMYRFFTLYTCIYIYIYTHIYTPTYIYIYTLCRCM